MEIIWHGNTCFTFKGKKTNVVINPEKDAGQLKGEIVLSSLKGNPQKVDGAIKVFDWPGEYEMKEVSITAFQAWTKSKSNEDKEGEKGDETILFYFVIDGIKCCHLGELGHIISSEMVNKIGDVDILIIKAGKNSNLDVKKAVEVVESIDPRAIIAMGENPNELMKELGANNISAVDKFVIKSISDFPEDKRTYILLEKS